MDPLGKKELITFYDMHLKHFGDRPQAVRWTREGQFRRYEKFLEIIGNCNGKSILDFGCGKGDFYGFLNEKNISVYYCGIDINENLISLANKKYKDTKTKFIAIDIDETEIGKNFDIVIACGVFNLRIAGIEELLKQTLKKLFSICKESLHACFLTDYIPYKDVELFYVKPGEILDFVIKEISEDVVIRHNKEDIYLSIYRGKETL